MNKTKLSKIFEITAKVLIALIILLLALILIGDIFAPDSEGPIAGGDFVAMIFFPVGFLVGSIISWKKPVIGSLIAINSMLIFYLVLFVLRGYFPRGVVFPVFLAPGLLNLASLWLRNSKT